jgi:isopenicillin N synthase-like dioxygenase
MYEGYKLHWDCPPDHPAITECALYGPNRWPAHLADMTSIVSEYWAACDSVASALLDICASAIGLEPETLRAWHEAPLTNMTLLHYPAQPPTKHAVGIHPHKDTNVITLLHPDPVGGLEVRGRDGSWIEPTYPSDALLVNIGEMLELWSGGDFVATPHRVINRSGRERYSFPYFVVPNHRVVVEPLVPCGDGFTSSTMPVEALSAEVWRTNWVDEAPATAGFDLGTLDR